MSGLFDSTTSPAQQEGAWNAKQMITSYLQWDLPTRLLAYRNSWQLDITELPDIQRFKTYGVTVVDEWPTIATVQVRTKKIERSDYTAAGDPIYRMTYQMRTFIWVRSDGPNDLDDPERDDRDARENVTMMRDRMVAVLRSSLLDRLCMHSGPHTTATHDVSLDEGTMTEEFSDIAAVKGGRRAASGFLSYEFSVNEPTIRLPIGTLSSLEVTGGPLQ